MSALTLQKNIPWLYLISERRRFVPWCSNIEFSFVWIFFPVLIALLRTVWCIIGCNKWSRTACSQKDSQWRLITEWKCFQSGSAGTSTVKVLLRIFNSVLKVHINSLLLKCLCATIWRNTKKGNKVLILSGLYCL